MKKCVKCQQGLDGKVVYGLHEECFLKWFSLDSAKNFEDLDPKKSGSSSSSTEIKKKKDTFFHGRYLKFSARLNEVEYILKIQEDKYPDLPAIEYVSNKIAAHLNLDVPEFFFIEFQGRPTFVTRNFMQDYVGTLNHIYKFLEEGEENHNCKKIIDAILKQTGKLADVAKFVETCLFDSFIGNQDRHGRNIGIIDTSKGRLLSPMYDNPSFFGIIEEFLLGADINPSGTIWTTKSKEPKPKDYLEEFKALGLERTCKQFVRRLKSRFNIIIQEVEKVAMMKKRQTAFNKFLHKRIREFENE